MSASDLTTEIDFVIDRDHERAFTTLEKSSKQMHHYMWNRFYIQNPDFQVALRAIARRSPGPPAYWLRFRRDEYALLGYNVGHCGLEEFVREWIQTQDPIPYMSARIRGQDPVRVALGQYLRGKTEHQKLVIPPINDASRWTVAFGFDQE